jgi:hypothetical protein
MKLDFKILIAGLVIIVVTNVIALAGVAYNRAGEPDAVVELTERELGMPYRYRMNKENTGLGLRINCRVEAAQYYNYGNRNCRGYPVWLDKAKLIELGFKLQPRAEKSTGRQAFEKELPRKVYLVLEYNGAAHQRAVTSAEIELGEQRALLINNPGQEEFEKRVEEAQKKLDGEQFYNSRLFAIDAGLDRTRLRNSYPDTSQYILMQALIRPSRNFVDEGWIWKGSITDLLIDTINIPLEHRALFEPLEDVQLDRNQSRHKPRFTVRVAFGKRAEPWVIAVEKM